MKQKLILILFCLVSISAMADEQLNYADWERLNKLASEPVDKPSYLPNKMQPVTDPNGVFQQVINFNLQEWKKASSTAKMLDTQWGSKAAGNTIAAQATNNSTTNFQVKPFETRAWVEFDNKWKASYNYQVVNHTSEFKVAPTGKILGMTVGYSYQITSADQRNLISLHYEW